MFVWKMLRACDSGSVGGDACCVAMVLVAATNDTLRFTDRADLKEHLLGLTLAIRSHGSSCCFGSWLERGDPDTGKQIFKVLGDAWKKVFAARCKDFLSNEMRKFATECVCDPLQRMLKAAQKNHGPYATCYSFNYMTQSRPAKPDASAAGGGSGAPPAPKKRGAGGRPQKEIGELLSSAKRRKK